MSPPSPLDVVSRFNAAWAEGDLESAIALVGEEAVYHLHISEDVLSFGGATKGRTNIEAAMRQMRRDFEYILYRPMSPSVDGEFVRFQVEFMYRHRASGEVLGGRFRHVMRVKNGVIVSADEYHDRPKVEAFLRLVSGRGPSSS